MLRIILIITLFSLGCGSEPENNLERFRSPRYQRTIEDLDDLAIIAKKATGGSLGCGVANLVYKNSKGEIKKQSCGLDPIHVLGPSIEFNDLHLFFTHLANNPNSFKEEQKTFYLILFQTNNMFNEIGSFDEILKISMHPDKDIQDIARKTILKLSDLNPDLKEKAQLFKKASTP